MFDQSTQQTSGRRFGIVEALVVAAILAFGGFVLVSDGRQSLTSLLAGFDETIGR